MDSAKVKALAERLSLDRDFAAFIEHTEAQLTARYHSVADAATGAITDSQLREMIGELRAVRTLKRTLVIGDLNARTHRR